MHLTIRIDDALLRQARQVSGVESDRELFERGLLALIKQATRVGPPPGTLPRRTGKLSEKLGPVAFETLDMPSVYRGPPLSLEDMQAAVLAEAERHK